MKRNRYLEAFKENHNLVGLATIVAASAALLSPVPLLIGVVAEVAYLMFYADSRWYELRLARRFDEDVAQRRKQLAEQVLPRLQEPMRTRFARLEDVRRDIDHQAKDDAQWFREVLRKLDFLLEKWLHFASKEAQFRDYLQNARNEAQAGQFAPSRHAPLPAVPNPARRQNQNPPQNSKPALVATPPAAPIHISEDAATRWVRETVDTVQAAFDGEINQIQAQADRAKQDGDDVTFAVLEKRLEVLRRRREFVGKIGRIQINLSHQLALVEDTFGLISDELRARPPEQVLADIEDVVSQTNTMAQILDEVAPLEQLLAA